MSATAIVGMPVRATEHLTRDDLKGWSTPDLVRFFEASDRGITQNLYNQAISWMELKDRGHVLPEIRSKLAQFLPDIANGIIAPELAQRHSIPHLLYAVRGMPLDEQRQLAAGRKVPVAIDTAGGTLDADVLDLAADLKFIRRAIRGGHIVPLAEQRARMRDRTKPKYKKRKEGPKIVMQTVDVGQGPYRPIPKETLNAANKTETEMTDLYPNERVNLRRRAVEAGISVRELIRMTLHAHGLLSPVETKS